MHRLLFAIALLYKSIPVLLNYLDLRRVWVDVDAQDRPLTEPDAGPVNGSHRVFVTPFDAALAAGGCLYALHELMGDD